MRPRGRWETSPGAPLAIRIRRAIILPIQFPFLEETPVADSQQQAMTKQRLQMLLNQLLEGVTDEQLQAMQTKVDQLELRAADGHHDHDHPKLV